MKPNTLLFPFLVLSAMLAPVFLFGQDFSKCIDDIGMFFSIVNQEEHLVEFAPKPDYPAYYGEYEHIDTLKIPSQVEYDGDIYTVIGIGNDVLSGAYIKSIVIPPTVRYIGNKALYYAYIRFQEIDLCNVDSLADEAFLGCRLNAINLGRVRYIGDNVFENCKGSKFIDQIYIPKETEHIGHKALCDLLPMRYSVNPDNPIYDSREDCNAIVHTASNCIIASAREMTFVPGGIKQIADYGMTGVRNMEYCDLPEAEEIGQFAFYNSRIRHINMPQVLTIRAGAFSHCDSLLSIRLGEPPVLDNYLEDYGDRPLSFNNFFPNTDKFKERCVLYVPKGYYDIYANDPVWGELHNIEEYSEEADNVNMVTFESLTSAKTYDPFGRILPSGIDTKGLIINNNEKRWQIMK